MEMLQGVYEFSAPSNATGESLQFTEPALVLSGISCSLSILGGVVIFSTYFAIPEIRNATRKLVLCLTAADILTAVGYLMSVVRYSAMDMDFASYLNSSGTVRFCEVQGAITTYSSLVSFFFTVVIAVHILATVVSRRDKTGTILWMIGFNVMSWGIPAVVVTLALSHRAIGEDTTAAATGPWCWVRSGHGVNAALWMWVTGKGWEIACYLLTTTLYMTLKFYLHRRHYKERFMTIQRSLRDDDKNFLYVWLILYILRIWGTLRFFLIVYNNSKPKRLMTALMYMQAFGDPAQAFCNFFLFCVLDSAIRSNIRQRFRSEEHERLINQQERGHSTEPENVNEPHTSSRHASRDAASRHASRDTASFHTSRDAASQLESLTSSGYQNNKTTQTGVDSSDNIYSPNIF